ncbi:CHAP domain-containing protein [Hominenteromicrobium sp.]
MAEPDKRQVGEGSDNYGEAAKQMANAAKQVGKESAKQAAAAGTKAVANASAAVVQASVEGGKAAAQIAAGTAAGGPWGAILSAAWALRHTLFKVLVCICLFFLLIIVMIVSLPSIILNSVFGLDGTPVDMENPVTIQQSYDDMAASISTVVQDGYTLSLEKVEQIIADGGYDYDLSMESLINYAQSSSGYDVSYILAAYSASLGQKSTSEADMLSKLDAVADDMFPVTSAEKEVELTVPLTYSTYREVTVTVVTSRSQTGTINGVPQYRYTTESRTYYEPDGTVTTTEPVTVPAFNEVTVSVPVYSEGSISGMKDATYYTAAGEETLTPDTEIIKYVECTIHPFDQSVILDAFSIDPNAIYDQFQITYREAIQNMANALKMTLYGTLGSGDTVALTDAELIAFVNQQNCNATRKHILTTALSLVGKVPYFWGGKSAAGWNDEWNTPKLVTASGSSTSGTIRPYGLDCSGFTDWVYKTALGVSLYEGTWNQWDNTYAITESELLPGDLGFMAEPGTVPVNHVLIYAGKGENGEQMWVHCASGTGVVLNSPDYVTQYRRPSNVDFEASVPSISTGTGTRRGNPAVAEIALSQVGNVGGEIYWRWYGFNSRVEWCACFVSWCYAQAGATEPKFSGCTSGGMGWFQSHGQWADRNYTDIAPGDAIFFDWDGSGDADHVGIVVGVENGTVYTVEGNSSGDMCRYNSYPLGSSVIRGYGLMLWN